MKNFKVIVRKGLAFALAAVLAGSGTDVSAAPKTERIFVEGVEIRYQRMLDADTESTEETDGKLALNDGEFASWIQRVKLPEEAIKLYETLEEGADGDGDADILIDPEILRDSDDSSEDIVLNVKTIQQEKELTSNQIQYIYSWIGAVTDAFDRDHPEVFWLSGTTAPGYGGIKEKKGTTYTYTYTFYLLLKGTVDGEKYDIRNENYQDPEKIKEAIGERDEAIKTICGGIPSDADNADKIQYFDQWLTHNNEYNTSADLNHIDASCRKCISALTGSTGTAGPVCEGYARALKVLCDSVSIPCVLVDGNAINSKGTAGAHMWNYVQLDDSWYGVDVTWDDPTGGKSGAESGYERQDYLLVGSDTEISGSPFLTSHPVENQVSTSGMAFTNGPVLSKTKYAGKAKVTVKPGLAGIYGTKAGSLTLTEGEVKQGEDDVEGTWSVSEEDKNKVCSVAGDTVKVIFTPKEEPQNTITVEVSPEITAKSVTSSGITAELAGSSYAYDGGKKEPAVTVTAKQEDGTAVLEQGKDYTVSYENNIKPGDHTAKAEIKGIGNYTGSMTTTFSITKAAAYDIEPISRSYVYRKGSNGPENLDLKELLKQDAGTVTYSVDAVTDHDSILDGTPSIQNGVLTFQVKNGSAGNQAEVAVTVKSDNYEDVAIHLNISLTDQKLVEEKTGSKVSVADDQLTYGDALSNLAFRTPEFVEEGTDTAVEGTLSWKDPDMVPDAGTQTVSWIFTPDDEAYKPAEGMISIEVLKATPVLIAAPTASAITYGDALGVSVLSEGSVKYEGTSQISVDGTFVWKNPEIKPEAGSTAGYEVTFLPKDSDHYNSIEFSLKLTVQKAASAPGMPAAEQAAESSCEKVSSVTLPDGWNWAEADCEKALIPEQGVTAAAIYAGADRGNYEKESVIITITRKKADEQPTTPTTPGEETPTTPTTPTTPGSTGSTVTGGTSSNIGSTVTSGTTENTETTGTAVTTETTDRVQAATPSAVDSEQTVSEPDSEAADGNKENVSDQNNSSTEDNKSDTVQTGNNSQSSNQKKEDKKNTNASTEEKSEYQTVSLKEDTSAVLKIDKQDKIKLQADQKKVTSVKYKVVDKGSNQGSVVVKLYKNKKKAYQLRVKVVNKKVKVTVLKGKGLKVKQKGKKTVITKGGKTILVLKKK